MSTIPEITFLQDRFAFGASTLTYPTDSSGGGLQAWFGPSFTATAVSGVPEPASLGLFAGGLLALAGIARRRKA